MSKYVDISKNDKGEWEYHDKETGVSMSQAKARKLIKEEKDKVEKEKTKLENQERYKKKTKWDFFGTQIPGITNPSNFKVGKTKKKQKGAWDNLISFD